MKFEIKRVRNGWICNSTDPETDEAVVGEETEEEVDGFANFLEIILENFGPSTGRYDKKRIWIITIPGDKYEGLLEREYREMLEYIAKSIQCALEQTKA